MKRFIEGEKRSQITLLPECLDDYIAEDNPVRVVDVFVVSADMASGRGEHLSFFPASRSVNRLKEIKKRPVCPVGCASPQ